MSVVDMPRIRLGELNDRGEWYSASTTLADIGISDIFLLPARPVMENIGVEISGIGTGFVEFSFATPDELEAGAALWTAWDGSSRVNPAVTAWRLVSTGGVKTARVIVKAV
jgi:hypothetical protein